MILPGLAKSIEISVLILLVQSKFDPKIKIRFIKLKFIIFNHSLLIVKSAYLSHRMMFNKYRVQFLIYSLQPATPVNFVFLNWQIWRRWWFPFKDTIQCSILVLQSINCEISRCARWSRPMRGREMRGWLWEALCSILINCCHSELIPSSWFNDILQSNINSVIKHIYWSITTNLNLYAHIHVVIYFNILL